MVLKPRNRHHETLSLTAAKFFNTYYFSPIIFGAIKRSWNLENQAVFKRAPINWRRMPHKRWLAPTSWSPPGSNF